MTAFNYVVCAVLLAGLIGEVLLVLRRNRTILLKGKDDYFSFCLVVLFVVIIFPLSDAADIVGKCEEHSSADSCIWFGGNQKGTV